MKKEEVISAFGSASKLARALKCPPTSICRIQEFNFSWKLRIIGAAFLLGLVEQLDLDNVRAEINARTKTKSDAL